MKTVAAVIFYSGTDPALLARCASSLQRAGISGAVFVDGPYAGLNESAVVAPEEQVRAIAENAPADTYVTFGRIYDSEPVKRTAAARFALREFPDATHLLLLDADEAIVSIDWDGIERRNGGLAKIIDIQLGEVDEDDAGGAMPRVFPLSEHLTWGPKHFDVRDLDNVYSGHGYPLTFQKAPDLVIEHDTRSEKPADYDAYNKELRGSVEGGLMITIREEGDDVIQRIDTDQATAFPVGRRIHLNQGTGRYQGPARVVSAEPSVPGCMDVVLRKEPA